jgi:hypothetical protein
MSILKQATLDSPLPAAPDAQAPIDDDDFVIELGDDDDPKAGTPLGDTGEEG